MRLNCIEALADECHEGSIYNPEFNYQKFAQLLMEQVLSIVDNAERGGDNEVWDNAINFVRKDLKEEFGVE